MATIPPKMSAQIHCQNSHYKTHAIIEEESQETSDFLKNCSKRNGIKQKRKGQALTRKQQ